MASKKIFTLQDVNFRGGRQTEIDTHKFKQQLGSLDRETASDFYYALYECVSHQRSGLTLWGKQLRLIAETLGAGQSSEKQAEISEMIMTLRKQVKACQTAMEPLYSMADERWRNAFKKRPRRSTEEKPAEREKKDKVARAILLKAPIDAPAISVRLQNCLFNAAIVTYEDVLKTDPREFAKLKNAGPKTLREMAEYLHEMGLIDSPDTEAWAAERAKMMAD